MRVYIRIDLVLVTRPQHGGHVERPRARRGVAPSWSAGATARDQPHTDEPAPFVPGQPAADDDDEEEWEFTPAEDFDLEAPAGQYLLRLDVPYELR